MNSIYLCTTYGRQQPKLKKYYCAVDDCIAQCAVKFSGGATGWYSQTLWGLIGWTDKAIRISEAEREPE